MQERPLTPSAMELVANRLDEAIAKFRSWKVRIHDSSRLPVAVRELRSVHTRDAFPQSRTSLARVAHAIRDAQDFGVICNMLPSEPLEPIAKTLGDAVKGCLGESPRAAYQAQSELWVGAMLTCAWEHVGVPTSAGGKRPDFVLRNGSMEYSVEVTRPAGLHSASKLVSEKAAQTLHKRYHGGALVVDLTDCLAPRLALGFGTGPQVRESVRAEFEEFVHRLRSEVFDDQSERIWERRRHLFSVIGIARTIWWDLDDLSQPNLTDLTAGISFLVDSPTRKTLRYHRAEWLARLVHSGIKALGHQSVERGYSDSSRIQIRWS